MLPNGPVDHPTDINRVVELQETIVRQNNELSTAHIKVLELGTKMHELEETLSTSQKELQRVQELNTRLQRDIREVSDCEGGILKKTKRYIQRPKLTKPVCLPIIRVYPKKLSGNVVETISNSYMQWQRYIVSTTLPC